MKPKGVSFIELHIEKLFLAVMALAALGVVAMQFTGEGNTVKVGASQNVRLDQAYEQIVVEAESKLGQLEQDRPSPSVPSPETDYAERYAAALATDLPPLSEVALARDFPGLGGAVDASGELVVEAVEVGEPARPETDAFLGAIEPRPQMASRFTEIYGEGPWPRDVRAITVETSFDAEALRDRLSRDPDGSGPAVAAPRGFWRSRHLIAAVVWERQRRSETGEWADTQTVPPAPGALEIAELVPEAEAGTQAADLLSLMKGDRGWEIVRPGFARQADDSTRWPPSFERRLERGEAVEELTAELERLQARGTSLRDIDELPLWTHDYDVDAGETYRYRARVWIPNPYYGFAPALAEESRSLAQEPFIEGGLSEWSEPVTAPRSIYWFAFSGTDGSEGAVAGEASARLDVFAFVGGRWRQTQERFEPGDAIRVSMGLDDGTTRAVDTGDRLLDVVRASLTDPNARGRQDAPVQVVATTERGLAVREVWRDRGSSQRRSLIQAVERAAAPMGRDQEAERPPARETERQEERRDEGRDARERQ